MTKRKLEENIFSAFLKANPAFAGERIRTWKSGENPPDILCLTDSGRTVGVELREWLDQRQMKEGKDHQRREESIARALAPQGDNNCKAIYFVLLNPKESVVKGIPESDWGKFREEVFRKVAELDKLLSGTADAQGESSSDFTGYPTLEKYVYSLDCLPRMGWDFGSRIRKLRTWPRGQEWIILPNRGGAYTHESMRDALIRALDEKRNLYRSRPKVEEFDLLLHYDDALLYNSPVETLDFTLDDAADAAKKHLNGDGGPFDRIFLFLAIYPGERTFRLY